MTSSNIQQPDEDFTFSDALRAIARHIDDHELPAPLTITTPVKGDQAPIVLHIKGADYPAWWQSLTRIEAESSEPAVDHLAIRVKVLARIGHQPVQLFTYRPATVEAVA